ncbi:MAG TPA: hypothetical protein PLN91_08370 [Rhodanobacteraceae bacterium]|nr:hypothetical protein [Rhodanobacteraceae bacterium]
MTRDATPPEFTCIADVVAALRARYAQRRAERPDAGLAEVQERFVRLDLYPDFGWPLVRAGVHQAVASGDARVLHEMLVKFVGLSGRAANRFDPDGLHPSSGADYCLLVPLAVDVAALGDRGLVQRLFHAGRPLSRHGGAALRHAANLLVLAISPDWRWRDQALAQANTGLQGKSLARVDRAFLTVFQSFVDDDPAQRRDALQEFAGLYTRSDWGRYKPWTQPVFLYGLVSLARWFCPSFDWSAEAAPLFDATWRALWTSYEARRGEFDARADAFDGDLAFLRCEP